MGMNADPVVSIALEAEIIDPTGTAGKDGIIFVDSLTAELKMKTTAGVYTLKQFGAGTGVRFEL